MPGNQNRDGRNGNQINAAESVIDSRRILYFYHVARLGSFTAAEEYLGVAQPAISRQVQLLEADLGAVLLHRDARGVSLTDTGRLVHDRARAIVELMSRTRVEVEETRDKPTGKVTIAVPSTFTTSFMPKIIRRFSNAYPEVMLRVLEGSSGLVHDLLLAGGTDIAILPDPPSLDKLTVEKLFSEQLYVVASPWRPLMQNDYIDVGDLGNLPFVLPASVHGLRSSINQFFRRTETSLSPVMELDSLTLIKEVIRMSPVYTILPRVAFLPEVTTRELAAVPLRPEFSRSVYLANLQGKPLSVAARVLANEVRNVVREDLRNAPPPTLPEGAGPGLDGGAAP